MFDQYVHVCTYHGIIFASQFRMPIYELIANYGCGQYSETRLDQTRNPKSLKKETMSQHTIEF